MEVEIWKPIPGYEGIYDASNLGRIRSTPGKTTSNARFKKRVWKTRVLKEKHPQSKKKRQDARVSLWKNGVEKDHLVSRLVASAWHGEPTSSSLTVNHINGNWKDNRPENLEWVTFSENLKYGFENGQYDSIQKKIILKDEFDNVFSFRSLSIASQFLGRNKGYISNAIKKNHRLHSSDGITYFVVRIGDGK